MSQGCSSSRIWCVLAVVFLLTTIVALCYIIWREVRLNQKESEAQVVARYKSFFRTVDEQREFRRRYFNISGKYVPVNSTIVAAETCNVSCIKNQNPNRFQLMSGVTYYHACCVSVADFVPEDYLYNMFGVLKKIAQFDNDKQFFKTEACSQVSNFYYGQCSQHQELVTAVTEDTSRDETYAVEWVYVQGCCKCINI